MIYCEKKVQRKKYITFNLDIIFVLFLLNHMKYYSYQSFWGVLKCFEKLKKIFMFNIYSTHPRYFFTLKNKERQNRKIIKKLRKLKI